MRVPEMRTGALLGLVITPALMAVMFLGASVARLPFTPFDLFDWLVRVLPGPVVTFGIHALVAVLTTLGFSLRAASKTAEQMTALGLFLGVGVVAGALLAVRATSATGRFRNPARDAALMAGVAGALIALIVPTMRRAGATASPLAGAAWVVICFAAWGYAFGRAWRALHGAPPARTRVFEALADGDHQAHEAAASSSGLVATDRRRFLIRLAGATASVTIAGAVLGEVLRSRFGAGAVASSPSPALPRRPGSLEPAPGTRPEYTPVADHYRIDVDLLPPHIDGGSWKLPVSGLVARPTELTLRGFEDHRYGRPLDLFVTLSCISNPVGGDLIGTTRWTGVSLSTVLVPLGLSPAARFVIIRSADGFYETVPLDLIMRDERVMLVHRWDGRPLPSAHGYPLRLFIPDRYGMKQPKWITTIEVTDRYAPGYWVVRGWDETAQVKATSVIDTVASDDAYEKGGRTFVPIGGIAYAGARGISTVEVKVDQGPWAAASLRPPLSDLTWVLWRHDWPFEAGSHTFAVRCYDGQGHPQIDSEQGSDPSGATSIDTVTKRL